MEEEVSQITEGNLPEPGSDDQMPKLEELQAICNLNTETVHVKVEPLDPEYLDNDSISLEGEACPENVVVKAEPFFFNNEDDVNGTTSQLYEEEEVSDKKIKSKKRKIKREPQDEDDDKSQDEDYVPVKKPIIKPKTDPSKIKKRADRKKRPTNKNLHSYNAITNIEVVSISEVERLEEHKAKLEKMTNFTYRCDNCAAGFISSKAYEKHMECHAERPGYLECPLCKCYMKSEEMLYQHKLRHYRRYRCLLCDDAGAPAKLHRDRETVACHIRTDHEQGRFLCEYCEKTFKRPAYLKNHVEQHHTKPLNLRCPECGQMFHQRNWFRWHLRKHGEQEVRQPPPSISYACEHCQKRVRTKKELAEHMATEHEGLTYTLPETKRKKIVESLCEPCNRVFTTKELLRHHNLRMHRDRTKNFQCDYCKRFYLTKSEVRSHIEWSHLRQPWSGHICAECGRQFRAPGLLRQHVRRAHAGEPPPPRNTPCPQCHKTFTSEQAVRRHQRSHEGVKFSCAACGEAFCSPQYARTHYQLRHLQMTRAEIRAAARAKKIAAGLITPEEAERSERLDKECPECGKLFASMQAVKRHQKSHTGVKYPCSECDDKFCSQTYAKIHYQLIHLKMTRAEIKALNIANKKTYSVVSSDDGERPVKGEAEGEDNEGVVVKVEAILDDDPLD